MITFPGPLPGRRRRRTALPPRPGRLGRAQRRGQRGGSAMAFDPAETRRRPPERQPHPAPNHRPVAPALDVAGEDGAPVSSGSRSVRRREQPPQSRAGSASFSTVASPPTPLLRPARRRVHVPIGLGQVPRALSLAARRVGTARAVGPPQHGADIDLPGPWGPRRTGRFVAGRFIDSPRAGS